MTATFFWVLIAFLAGLAARALRLPTLVGYLAAGLVLAILGVQSTPLLDDIADLGVMLLLFTLGLHLQLRSMLRPEVLGVGTAHLLLSTPSTAVSCCCWAWRRRQRCCWRRR